MIEIDEYDLNPKYRALIDRGFTIEATTARANSGTLLLMFRDEVLASVTIKTNGRGTREILKAIPTAKKRTHLDGGLTSLFEAAKLIDTSEKAATTRYKIGFVASYQEAVSKHANEGCSRVLETLESQPTAKTSKLFKVFSNEVMACVAREEK